MKSSSLFIKNLIVASQLLSLICIVWLIIINDKIAIQYQNSGGKTKAMFGLIEGLSFGYKYYFLFPALLGTFLGGWALSLKKDNRMALVAVVMGCISVVLVFVKVWRFMI